MDIRNSNGIYILRRRGPDRRRHVPDNRTSPSESGGLSLARAAHQSGRRIYRLSFAPTPELLVHRDVVNITISMNYVYIKQVYTYTRQKVQYGKLKSVLIGHLLSHVLLLLNDLVQLFFVFEVLSPIADGTMQLFAPEHRKQRYEPHREKLLSLDGAHAVVVAVRTVQVLVCGYRIV